MMNRLLLAMLVFALAVPTMGWAQGRTIKGVVTSGEDNAALPGVNVVIKGTQTGASTNAEGVYTITIPAGQLRNGTLVFSFIGMKPQEVPMGKSEHHQR